jgi:nitric oxide reductase large subunit
MPMKKLLLIALVAVLYLLHQDFWFWRESQPMVFGFLPIGLFYHLVYTLAVVVAMWLLVKFAWPAHLETQTENPQSEAKQ